MNNTEFVYTTYIKSTPDKVWQAITNPEFATQYWVNKNISDWKKGSEWKHVSPDGSQTMVTGKVLESNPPKRLVLTWAAPDDLADVSQVSFDIEMVGGLVKLDVVHNQFKQGSTMPGKISKGWPLVLCSLKSLLETGKAIDIVAVKGPCGADGDKSAAA
ncbi:MAG: SRPBCC family protein [Alphaproteobacteria bacterium]